MKTCKACGLDNRDEAKFCRGCGSPLPQKKEAPRDLKKEKAVKKFWTNLMIGLAAAGLVGLAISSKLSGYEKIRVVNEYASKFDKSDDMAFGTVTPKAFYLQSLGWNMTAADIKALFPYAVDSSDPDFLASMTVAQGEFKVPIPHANFMSLGLYNGRLYAVKFEFGALEQFEAQQLKVPNKDEILFGRYRGIYKTFTNLYGRPVKEKNEVGRMPVLEGIKAVKAGKLSSGAPSNIYIFWDVGNTRVELVYFGDGKQAHLTVRYLYIPVWNVVGK
jgi:hypothetical protein